MSPNCCDAGRIVSVAVIVAVGVNTEGQREVLGVKVGASEAESFWTEFLRSLNRRGLRGVKLVISDSHEGIKAAASKVLKATWQRCRVHFMRNALAYANKTQRRMVSAAIGTVFVQETAEAATKQWRSVADQFREKLPKLAACMDEAESDVLACMTFPRAHWSQIHSTNPLEQLNAEIKRRTNVVGIFPSDAAITRLVGAMMHEQNDEWSLNRRYMQLEGLPAILFRLGCRQCRAEHVNLSLPGLTTYTTPRDITYGRVEPKWDSDFAPETCHSSVLRRQVSERAVKDGFWPTAVGRERWLRRCAP